MSILTVGASHKSAPVPLLERLALDGLGAAKLGLALLDTEHVTEAVVLATCNRVEVYAAVDRFHGSVEDVSRLLVNRAVQAVVIENGAESILADGLAYDRCAVGIVTDLDGAEKLAAYDIQEPDQMVKVLRTQVDVVLAEGTLLAEGDPQVVARSADVIRVYLGSRYAEAR